MMKFNQPTNKEHINNSFCFDLQFPQTNSSVEFKVEEGEYSFYLNQTIIEQIEKAQTQGMTLYIPPGLALPLWYYTFFAENGEDDKNKVIYKNPTVYFIFYVFLGKLWQLLTNKNQPQNTIFQSGFTFNSYYQPTAVTAQESAGQNLNIILQTTALFDGDIINKVRQDFIENPDCLKIVSAHYWLTEKIINHIRSDLNALYWFISAIFPASLMSWKVSAIVGLNFLGFLLVWTMLFLALAVLILFIVNEMRKYIGQQNSQERIYWFVWLITNFLVDVSSFSNYPVLFVGNLGVMALMPNLFKWLVPKLGKVVFKRFLN